MRSMRPGATKPAARPRRRWLWSYRLKVPLALSVVALAAGVAVAATTYLLVYRHVEANAFAQTQRLARTLARSLAQPILANDVWQAFQTVRASSPEASSEAAAAPTIVVVDARGEIFVALDPRTHPLGTSAARLPDSLAAAARWTLTADAKAPPYAAEDQRSGSLVVAERIVGEEESLLGGVIVQQESGLPRAQAHAVAARLAALGAAAIAIVAIIGWFVGRRMIRPLEQLRAAMREAPSADVRPKVATVSRLNDEVGDLGASFLTMMDEIDAKRELERQMLQAERMASIGRLTASIAHEVNNPLGGMLSAIENRRLRGGIDEATERTLALLQRGITQIHSTVGALLNEARHEVHELREEDLHDLHVLLLPEAAHCACALDWSLRMPATGRLPSVPVRQVLLNLTLNAIAAAGIGGRVRVGAEDDGVLWRVQVANSGAALDAQRFGELVAGQTRADGERTGLGLWITARVLHALGGTLELAAPDVRAGASTVIRASFPLRTA